MTTDVNIQFSQLTGARQTMMSWAKVIESYEAVPAAYKDTCRMLFGDSQVFPYVVLAPAFGRFRPTEKLLGEVNNTLYVLERIDRNIVTTRYPLNSLRDIEIGNILLHSWITFNGVTSDGLATSTTVEFNEATARHFAPFLNKIRPAAHDAHSAGLRVEQAKFNYLGLTNFKFMNFACESLVSGEKVIHSVWQPEIRKRIVTLFGRSFYQTTSLAHLTILTDKEVILIWDDKRSSENKGIRYGGVWRYIPLRHIAAVEFVEQANGLLTLSLHFFDKTHLDKVFVAASRRKLEYFQTEIEKLIG